VFAELFSNGRFASSRRTMKANFERLEKKR